MRRNCCRLLMWGLRGVCRPYMPIAAVTRITRLETLVLMGINLPLPAIRRQIAAGFDIFVHLGRLRDKSRRLLEICEIDGIVEDEVVLNPLFLYEEECGLVQKGKLKHRSKLERAGITLEDGL